MSFWPPLRFFSGAPRSPRPSASVKSPAPEPPAPQFLCSFARSSDCRRLTSPPPQLNCARARSRLHCFAAPPRSHVERFSTVETRAERVEADANAKLAADPQDAAALNSRAVARLFLGRYKEAHEDLRRAVALKPESAAYHANLGSTLWKLGRPEEAVAAERAAVMLDIRTSGGLQSASCPPRLGGQRTTSRSNTFGALWRMTAQHDVRRSCSPPTARRRPALGLEPLYFLGRAPSDPRRLLHERAPRHRPHDPRGGSQRLPRGPAPRPLFPRAWQDLGLAS